nr:retrovirus-related Pol polyprotein from transposon TNT 1-94 [Tanacetum cinerariifolium]
MSKQCTKPKRKRDEEWFKDKVLLERILKKQTNVDKASASCTQSLEIETLKHTLSEHLKEKESLEQKVTLLQNDLQKEESRNIDRELALEKQVKELNNIMFKRNQTAQTVHMLTKPQFFYDHSTRQALDFQNPCYLKRAQQLRPKLYDGSVIQKTDAIAELSAKQAFWSRYSVQSEEPNLSSSTTIVEPKKEPLPQPFGGHVGFEHTKACFRDDIIPFVKALKELFNSFDQFLIDELTEVQNVFHQMEQAVEQHYVEKNKFQDKMKNVLKDNDQLLEQAISIDIVNIVVHDHVNTAYKTVNVFNEAVTLHLIDPELLKIDVAPLTPKLRNNRTAHTDYLRHTQEETATLREIVENKPVVTLVYSRKSKAAKKKVPISNPRINKSLVANETETNNSWGSTSSNVPSSVIELQKFLGTVKFRNDHVAKIMGYGDYKIGNVTISRVYFVEGLGHNLFSEGQFCDSDLEVSFRQHTCFIRNLDGVDLLTGSRGKNLYTLSLQDMMTSSPICLLSKASKTKSWLWHHRLSHLNFGAINHLARQGLVKVFRSINLKRTTSVRHV